MNEVILKYYRRLLREGFGYTGTIENPSIFLDSVGENLPICGRLGRDYLHLYINVREGIVNDIKYLCTCDPTANVVFEVLCSLAKGKSVQEVEGFSSDTLAAALGVDDADFHKKAKGVLELMRRGFDRLQPVELKD
jgi:NifU-like protein involved in Fe-S cluster formation